LWVQLAKQFLKIAESTVAKHAYRADKSGYIVEAGFNASYRCSVIIAQHAARIFEAANKRSFFILMLPEKSYKLCCILFLHVWV
jgi:hypothetical protein